MKINRQKYNWYIDAILLLIFISAYELDLTGLPLHQWLGIAAGIVALYHFLLHLKWVKSVTEKFSTCSPWKTQLCYLVDTGLMLVMWLTIASGVLISTWLDIPFEDYFLWKTLHITLSILTLLLTAFKVMLHWRWIINISRQKLLKLTTAPTGRTVLPANKPAAIGRSDFLKMMGVVSAATGVVLVSFLHEEQYEEVSSPISNTNSISNPTPVENASPAENYPSSVQDLSSPTEKTALQESMQSTTVETGQNANELTGLESESAAVENPLTDTEAGNQIEANASEAAVQVIEAPAATEVATVCSIQCPKNRHCSYPGRCREYVDNNNNGLCDLGECI